MQEEIKLIRDMRRRNPNSRVYRTSGLDSESRGYTRTQPTPPQGSKGLKTQRHLQI